MPAKEPICKDLLYFEDNYTIYISYWLAKPSKPPKGLRKLERQVEIMAKNTVKNVNKDMLVQAIVAVTDLTKKDTEAVIEAMVDTITKELSNGSKVTLTGFGTFKVSQRAAREGINPQTKAKITIPAMTVPKFTAGKSLKEAVK